MRIQEAKRIFSFVLLLGFVSGILYANFFSIEYMKETGIFSDFFLEQYKVSGIDSQEYFLYLLRMRSMCFGILALLSGTKANKVSYLLFILWTGFGIGMIFTAAAMKQGLCGIVFCILALTPHIIFYAGAFFIAIWHLFIVQKKQWELRQVAVVIVLFIAGILLESYVNPVIMQFAVRAMIN